jgi:hypothetical protein
MDMKLPIRKYILLLLAVLLIIPQVKAQLTNSKNYIISRTFKQAGAANTNDVSQVVTQVQYLDGLGRPIQSTTVGQSTMGTDIIQPMAYDALGREANKYLPYVKTASGAYQGSGVSDAAAWYIANTAKLNPGDLGHPSNETFFEQSPLNRPSGEKAPGTKSATSVIQYKVNDGSEVKRYDFNGTVTANGTYAAGALIREYFKDEQGHETNEYTDKLGQLICKKVTADQVLTTY